MYWHSHEKIQKEITVLLHFLHLFQKGEIFQPSWILPNMFLHFLLRDLCMCVINSASALKSPPTNRHPLTSLSQITVRCKVILRSTAVLLVRAMGIRQWRHWTSIWGSKKRPYILEFVTYILLLKIFSAKLLFIFKNLIRISMVYLPVHRSLKSWVLRLIILLRKISWGLLGVTNFFNNLNIGSNIH